MKTYQLGDTLRMIREANQIHINELAHRLSVVPRTIYKWENSERTPSLSILLQISEALNCSIIFENGEIRPQLNDSMNNAQQEKLKTRKAEVERMNLKLLRTKGDIKFYENESGELFHQLLSGDIIKANPEIEGYELVESCEDFTIKYALNGYDGLSVWRHDELWTNGIWTRQGASKRMGEFLLAEKDVRPEVIDFMEEHKTSMAENHLECWSSRYAEYETLEDVEWDLNVNHDPSLEFEWVQDNLEIELTCDEERFVEETFNEEILHLLRNRWI